MLYLKTAEVNQLNLISFLKQQNQLARESIKNFY